MATTVTSTERVIQKGVGLGGDPHKTGPNGNGHRGNGGGDQRKDDSSKDFSPNKYRITMWIVLAAVMMMFMALTFAYVMLSSSDNWRQLKMPNLLWLSTGLIILSSMTFESARKSLKHGNDSGYSRWLLLTVILGLAFLASQLLAWQQLVAEGTYVASNPHSSFFYLLTGAHGVHLLGGILALDYLLIRTRRRRNNKGEEMKRQMTASVVSLYWHFMDGLWIYLFLLLLLWR